MTVFYREPTFDAWSGQKREPFRGTFEVWGDDPAEAVEAAKEEFRRWARLSSVSWVREIVRTECVEVEVGKEGRPKLVVVREVEPD